MAVFAVLIVSQNMILRIGWLSFPNLLAIFYISASFLESECAHKNGDDDYTKPDMKHVLEESRIIPDALEVAPRYELKVKFADEEVNFGNFMHPDQLTDESTISINTTVDDAYHFLIMTDLDYPAPNSPDRREYLHWMVFNIKGVNLFGEDSDVLTAYVPPGVNAHGAGTHRYMFYYIRTNASGPTFDYLDWALPKKKPEHRLRTNFSMRKFTKKWGLVRPMAVNFFRITWVAEEDEEASIH